jgi:flagellar basal-body rod modification protein FlgD
MATTALGIWNHHLPAQQPQSSGASLSSGNASASGTDAATISANDFLTLLVTEMKNQDPTANTDPNEYINQLVQVNSLEQLISINQTLIADSGGSTANPSANLFTRQAEAGALSNNPAGQTNSGIGDKTSPTQGVVGNLSIPAAKAAAMRVAQSLAGIHPPPR